MSSPAIVPAAAKGERIGQLDGVRALAVGAVFLNHAFMVKMLWAGVDLFFILSGFLITGILLSAKERTLRSYFAHFYGRRVRRILPPLALLLLVTTLAFGPAWMRYAYLYPFLMNFQSVLNAPQPDVLSSLWSLAVEEQFYLVWPFVVYFLSETAVMWVAAALLVAAPVLRALCTPLFADHFAIYTLTPFRMDLLAAGALFTILWRRRRDLLVRFGLYGPVVSLAAAGVLVGLSLRGGFSTLANTRTTNVWVYELSLIAAAGLIAWALSGRFVGLLNFAPMRYIGRVSYSIYLIHVLLIILVRGYLIKQQPLLSAAVALGLTLAYAALSWHFVEKPILFAGTRSRVRRSARLDEAAITAPGQLSGPLPSPSASPVANPVASPAPSSQAK